MLKCHRGGREGFAQRLTGEGDVTSDTLNGEGDVASDTTEQGLIHKVLRPSQGSPPHPGLLLLHGRGSNEDDLLPLGPQLDPRLLVVSARAPFELARDAYYWYDLEASLAGRPSKESIEYSLHLVRRLLEDMVSRYEVDSSRNYVGGFSMGGAMAAAAVLTLPREVRGALIFSGYLPIHSNLNFKPDEVPGHPVFEAHGTLDGVLPVEVGRMTRDYFAKTGVDLTYREYPIAHEVSGEELADASDWMNRTLA